MLLMSTSTVSTVSFTAGELKLLFRLIVTAAVSAAVLQSREAEAATKHID